MSSAASRDNTAPANNSRAASARALVDGIHSGQIDAVAVAEQAAAAAIAGAKTPVQSGVVTATPDLALEATKKIASAPGQTRSKHDLAGLPITVKDLYPIAGVHCTMGSARLAHTATATAAPVEALIQRGAVIVGTTATSEFGLTAYTEPIDLPAPDNPLRESLTPGGSSGGSAVAVARDIVPTALGSDGGGSIRIPAACCGLVGLKPAHNTAGGRLATPAFLTHSLDDAALLAGMTSPSHHTQVCAHTGAQSRTHRRFARAIHAIDHVLHRSSHHRRMVRPARIGVCVEPFHIRTEVADTWAQAALSAAEALADAGYEVVEVSSPYGSRSGEKVFEQFTTLLTSSAASLPDADYSEMARWLRGLGREMSSTEIHQAQQFQQLLPARVRSTWSDIDAVLTPTLAGDPPPIGYFNAMRPEDNFYAQTHWTPWLSLWNLTGWAGLSIPWPSTADCAASVFPTSVHLGAVRCDAADLLTIATVLEHNRLAH